MAREKGFNVHGDSHEPAEVQIDDSDQTRCVKCAAGLTGMAIGFVQGTVARWAPGWRKAMEHVESVGHMDG